MTKLSVRAMLKTYQQHGLLAIINLMLGASLTLGYAPFSLWFVIIPALSVWLWLLEKYPKQAVFQTFHFGLGWFGAGISWVYVSIDQFGGLPQIISLQLMLLLCSYLALFPLLAIWLTRKLSNYFNQPLNLWLLPFFWFIAESLRGVLLTGFPWLSLGYSQLDGPLHYLAPIVGETGITLFVWLLALAIVQLGKPNTRYIGIIAGVILISLISVSSQLSWLQPQSKQVKVALVQGNIEQSLKWQPEHAWPTMSKYLGLTREHYDADIIVWPESAVPEVEPLAQEFLDLVNQAAALNNTSVITGIINYQFDSKRYFNSLIVLGKKSAHDTQGQYRYQNANRYSKYHLLPIGEFVPFENLLRPLAPLFNLPMSSFTRGNYQQTNLQANGIHILPLICFEIAFPNQLKANIQANTDIILTVSNDAWFGDSHGPHQHLDIARMRALEFGLPVIRTTNNGITASIDAWGKVQQQVPQFSTQVLTDNVQLVTGTTPYRQFGDLVAGLLSLLLWGFAVYSLKIAENSHKTLHLKQQQR